MINCLRGNPLSASLGTFSKWALICRTPNLTFARSVWPATPCDTANAFNSLSLEPIYREPRRCLEMSAHVVGCFTEREGWNMIYDFEIIYSGLSVIFYATQGSVLAVFFAATDVKAMWESDLSTLYIFSLNYSFLLNEITFILEFMTLYVFLSLLTNLLKSLNSAIYDIQNNLYLKDELSMGHSNSILVEKLIKWAELYDCLMDSSKQLSACFNHYVNVTF